MSPYATLIELTHLRPTKEQDEHEHEQRRHAVPPQEGLPRGGAHVDRRFVLDRTWCGRRLPYRAWCGDLALEALRELGEDARGDLLHQAAAERGRATGDAEVGLDDDPARS